MQRASYRDAIRWIAENDSAGESDALDVEPVSQLITSALVADIFGVEPERVGQDVVRERRKWAALTDPRRCGDCGRLRGHSASCTTNEAETIGIMGDKETDR